MRILTISKSNLQALETHADSALPAESCALLVGTLSTVKRILFMRNSAEDSRFSFSISPIELIAAYAEAETSGMDIVGIFHSHPGPAKPSRTDVKFMEINGVMWLIYSTTEKTFAAHFFDSGSILPVSIAQT